LASVEAVKSFGDYGTVIINTHGWFTDPERPKHPRPGHLAPGFRTGTVNGTVEYPRDDFDEGRLAVSKRPICENYHYVVFPKFIEKYVTSPMKDTFLFLGFCHSLQNDRMWQAFKAKGARAAIGWDDEVDMDVDADFFTSLMSHMLPDDEYTKPMTVSEAFDTAKAAVVSSKASPVQYVDNSWENFVYLPFPMMLYPEGKSLNYYLRQPDKNVILYTGISDENTFYQTNFGFINYNIN